MEDALKKIDSEVKNCNACGDLVEHFPNSKTISLGKTSIMIIGEAPANNGWRKSGVAWYDVNGKILPSGVILKKLLNIINVELENTHFVEAIKCYPKSRTHLKTCNKNCRKFLINQIDVIKPKLILTLGDEATRAVLNLEYKNFKEVVGKIYNINGYKVIPIYHPSPVSPMSYKGNIPIMENIKESINESLIRMI